MKWIKIEEQQPPYGEYIWMWDAVDQKKLLIKYMGSEETWLLNKNNKSFPLWANLNDQEF